MCHLENEWKFILNELIHRLAIDIFVTLMAQVMLVQQLRLVDNHLRKIIMLQVVDWTKIYIKKFDRPWKAIVMRRSPYSEENTRSPHRREPITKYPVSDSCAAMELTI